MSGVTIGVDGKKPHLSSGPAAHKKSVSLAPPLLNMTKLKDASIIWREDAAR